MGRGAASQRAGCTIGRMGQMRGGLDGLGVWGPNRPGGRNDNGLGALQAEWAGCAADPMSWVRGMGIGR